MQEVTVTNLPVWTLWVIAISQIIFAISVAVIAAVLVKLIGQITQTLPKTLSNVEKITDEAHRNILPSVEATLKNVKAISDDARDTAHNVTGTVNRVSHVAGSVAGRLESPLVKTVGALSGVAAGVRTLRGGGKKEVVVTRETKKRGGLLGFFK